MKILYLTFESRKSDPIIDSQVVTLIEEILLNNNNDNTYFTLLSFGKEKISDFNDAKFTKIEKINRGFIFNTFILLGYLLRNLKTYDIIHIRSYLPMFGIGLLKPFLKSKIIFDPRGAYPEEILYLFKSKNFPYYFFSSFERFFYKLSDAIIVVSSKFKQHIITKHNLDSDNIFVIPTFCQKRQFNHGDDAEIDLKKDVFKNKDVTIFGFSGGYGNWQLTDDVFRFFEIVSENIQDSVFIIFSKEKELFDEKITQLNIDKSKFFVKSLNKNELQVYMQQIDFGVLFRDNSVVNKVAAPIKVKDYLINGVKIIMTTNIGDDSDFVLNNKIGYVINDLSKESMIQVINNIKNFKNHIDREDIIKIVEKEFGVDKIAGATLKLYFQLEN